jgi:hypothetical protein
MAAYNSKREYPQRSSLIPREYRSPSFTSRQWKAHRHLPWRFALSLVLYDDLLGTILVTCRGNLESAIFSGTPRILSSGGTIASFNLAAFFIYCGSHQ